MAHPCIGSAGLAGALAFGRLLQSYLFETEPACLGPARRATKVDPLVALRAD